MHIDETAIDAMQLPELDELRHRLKLSKRELCRRAEINVSTYTRWMRQLAGVAGGTCPQPRSIKAIRQALHAEIEAQRVAVGVMTAMRADVGLRRTG